MAMYRLKKKCGNHIGPPDKDGNRTTYKAGDKVQSDEDLVAKWPGKFELIGVYEEGPVPKAPKIPKGKKKETVKTKPTKPEPPVESEHGIDVTDDFPTAAKVELQVFEKSKWFIVIDPDNGEVLNEKKLRKKNVESFLEDYLPDDKTDDDEDEDDVDDVDDEEDNEED